MLILSWIIAIAIIISSIVIEDKWPGNQKWTLGFVTGCAATFIVLMGRWFA